MIAPVRFGRHDRERPCDRPNRDLWLRPAGDDRKHALDRWNLPDWHPLPIKPDARIPPSHVVSDTVTRDASMAHSGLGDAGLGNDPSCPARRVVETAAAFVSIRRTRGNSEEHAS